MEHRRAVKIGGFYGIPIYHAATGDVAVIPGQIVGEATDGSFLFWRTDRDEPFHRPVLPSEVFPIVRRERAAPRTIIHLADGGYRFLADAAAVAEIQ